MTHLIATGTDGKQYWRRELTRGEVVRLGRAPRKGWAVPWDLRVSREHADLELVEQGLRVTVLETARNASIKSKSSKNLPPPQARSFRSATPSSSSTIWIPSSQPAPNSSNTFSRTEKCKPLHSRMPSDVSTRYARFRGSCPSRYPTRNLQRRP